MFDLIHRLISFVNDSTLFSYEDSVVVVVDVGFEVVAEVVVVILLLILIFSSKLPKKLTNLESTLFLWDDSLLRNKWFVLNGKLY